MSSVRFDEVGSPSRVLWSAGHVALRSLGPPSSLIAPRQRTTALRDHRPNPIGSHTRARAIEVCTAIIALLVCTNGAHAEEGRFDAQVFRPSAAPRDLVMVEKSEIIAHGSPTLGLYYDFGVDPLVLVAAETGQTIDAVGARLQVTGLMGIGLFDWMDVKLAVPFVAWQTSDNLRTLGTEGTVRSTALGDMRLAARVAIPTFNRRKRIDRGFGLALAGNLNLPTGDPMAFTGDGVVTGGVTLIGDYRFGVGALIAANAGVWLRPDRQLAGVRMGDMASFGVAGEAYIVQRWGLSVVGGAYGYPSLSKFPDSPRQVPVEGLLALRWQSKHGITMTFGGSFGAACGFGAPAIRFFSGVTWQPKRSREQEAIDRILRRQSYDPDSDGIIGEVDRCPERFGPPENRGCPDEDLDKDGVIDRDDQCPDLPQDARGKDGCPVAFIEGDQITVLEQVRFATDQDIILDTSKPVLEAVARVLEAHPEIAEIRIEGHTDVRAGDKYNMDLSDRRVKNVRSYLVASGIAESRLIAKGYGHKEPLVDDSGCNRPDEELDPDCLLLTRKNRRVVFRIVRWEHSGRIAPRRMSDDPPGRKPGQ